ncbi:MAG: prepilin peptidase [Treponema sp.]|nr:prepilin peptidase [Treponema sp.]
MYHTILTAVVILFPLVAAIEDILSFKVHRILWILGMIVVFAVHGFFNLNGLVYHGEIAAVSFAFFYLVRLISKKGLGFADVLMAAFMGSLLNLEKMIYAVIYQILISLVLYALVFIISKKRGIKISFIPVMSVSLWICWFAI